MPKRLNNTDARFGGERTTRTTDAWRPTRPPRFQKHSGISTYNAAAINQILPAHSWRAKRNTAVNPFRIVTFLMDAATRTREKFRRQAIAA